MNPGKPQIISSRCKNRLPEQELLEMEGDQDEVILDDRLLQRERRTGLRH